MWHGDWRFCHLQTAYLPDALDGGSSLASLAHTAAFAGYAVVVLDVSASELAVAALAAANSLILVAAPTLAGVAVTLEASRLVREVMAGRHPIPPQAVHLVLNRVRASTLTPEEAVGAAQQFDRRLPALAAVIHDDPAIEESAVLRRPAYYHSDTLRQAAKRLGDLLFASPALSAAQREARVGQASKVYTFGPVRVRV